MAALFAAPADLGSVPVQQVAGMVTNRARPFVLVLDDVHELVDQDARDVSAVIVREMPAGSMLVRAGRSALPVPLGRLRARRELVEVGLGELAFDHRETAALLSGLDSR